MIADSCEGGYKDVDIENKIAALKIKWVRVHSLSSGKAFNWIWIGTLPELSE